MGEALHEAWRDLRHKEEIWRGARATIDHVRTRVREVTECFKAPSSRKLPLQDALVLNDLEDAKDALVLATVAESAARKSLALALDEYMKLELAWAVGGLSRFYVGWLRARAATKACRG